jgi:CMP-N-acetylneuraminic acid synthetase
MRTSDTVKRFLNEWDSPGVFDKFDSAFSVTQESNEHWVNIDSDLVRLSKLVYEKEKITRSQDRLPVYKENGAIYLTRASSIRNGERFITGMKYSFLCNKFESIDIDTAEDLEVAEAFYERSKQK